MWVPFVIVVVLAIGTLGWVMFAVGPPELLWVAAPLAFGAGTGWAGLMHFALVSEHPDNPAAASATVLAFGYTGGAVVPAVFGFVADHAGYTAAWMLAAAAAVLLLVAVGGVLVLANSGGEYVSLPDDCSEAVDPSVLDRFFENGAPALTGSFDPDDRSIDSSYGTLSCSGESGSVTVEVSAELVDLEDPETLAEFEDVFDGTEFNDDFMDEPAQPGEIHDEDFGLGMTASYLWDLTNVGDQSIALAMATDAGDDFSDVPGASNNFAIGVFLTDNIAGGIIVNDSEGGRDVQDLFNAIDSASGDLANQLRRVAD